MDRRLNVSMTMFHSLCDLAVFRNSVGEVEITYKVVSSIKTWNWKLSSPQSYLNEIFNG